MAGDVMGRLAARAARWGWVRALILACAVGLLAVAGVHYANIAEVEGQRAEAARVLAESSPRAAPSAGTAATEAPPPDGANPASSAPHAPPAVALPRFPLPPTGFAWPAAGLSVGVVPMAWTVGERVDPPLDANGFDPVAHWLAGTGESPDLQPVVLAGHACRSADPLCTPETFPFNLVSFPGWEKGQAASISDANGRGIPCILEERRTADKASQFSFPNDPCLVVVISCNYQRPDDEIILVTFRCGHCP